MASEVSTRIVAHVKGLRVFDPRDKVCKHTENPALILRDMLCQFGFEGAVGAINDATFIKLADFCDEQGWTMSAVITKGKPKDGAIYAETYAAIPEHTTEIGVGA